MPSGDSTSPGPMVPESICFHRMVEEISKEAFTWKDDDTMPHAMPCEIKSQKLGCGFVGGNIVESPWLKDEPSDKRRATPYHGRDFEWTLPRSMIGRTIPHHNENWKHGLAKGITSGLY